MVSPTKNTAATDLGKLLGIVWFDYYKGEQKEKRQQGIRELFKRSYEVLDFYHKDALVPKEVSELLLEMDGFLYFASLITDKEFDDNPYLYQAVHSLAEALKNGFF